MAHIPLQRSVTEDERRHFRLGDFPQTNSERREFIFARTGFSAKPLDRRGWYLFNQSMNEGLSLELDERTLQVLSLMDHALADVRRFGGMPHMHEIASDSTAAHTKQVMSIIQHVSEQASGGHMSEEMDALRRDAILGAWIHDMGEMVIELTTASDMFNMPADKREGVSQLKNALERDLFLFSCALANHAVASAQPDLFRSSIMSLREAAQQESTLVGRIDAIRQGMQRTSRRLGLAEIDEGTEHLHALYDRVESKAEGNFLHPFVKTLEAVEGHRYLQRNSSLLKHTRLDLITSNEITEGCRRCEKRLPDLFASAGDDWVKGRLARAATEFTYRSIARQFLPKQEDHVSVAPDFIRRDAVPETEPFSNALLPDASLPLLEARIMEVASRVANVVQAHPACKEVLKPLHKEFHAILGELKMSSLETTRAKAQQEMAQQWQPGSANKPIYSREEAGVLYRAAERAVTMATPFIPQSSSLICMADTPQLPKRIEQLMRDITRELHAGDRVRPLHKDKAQR